MSIELLDARIAGAMYNIEQSMVHSARMQVWEEQRKLDFIRYELEYIQHCKTLKILELCRTGR